MFSLVKGGELLLVAVQWAHKLCSLAFKGGGDYYQLLSNAVGHIVFTFVKRGEVLLVAVQLGYNLCLLASKGEELLPVAVQ